MNLKRFQLIILLFMYKKSIRLRTQLTIHDRINMYITASMIRHILFLAAFLFVVPLSAHCVPVEESEGVLEEPGEAGESDVEMPKNALPDESIADKPEAKKQDVKNQPMPPEKKPEDSYEGGFNTVVLQGLNKVTGRASKI